MAATREALAQSALDQGPPQALYPKLRPGPGKPAQEVASHQRNRLYGAMIEIVGERGYGAVTVRELTRLAGVSTRAFYEHFEDKEDCFVRTYEAIAREMATRIVTAQKSAGPSWEAQLRAGSLAYACELADYPRAARLAMVEALTAGTVAPERTRSVECMFERLIADSFARAPDRVEVPSIFVEGVAAGVEGVACSRLLAGRERELPGLVDDMLEWALCYRAEAAAEMARFEGRLTQTPVRVSYADDRVNGRNPSDERERILSAVAKLAVAEDYRYLTVPRIRTEAGVSRRCFDSHFKDVGECFLASLELRVERALSYAAHAATEAETWASGVHRAIFALCTLVEGDPVLAKIAFAEVFAPGPEGLRCRERLMARITRLLRESAPPHQRPRELAAEVSVRAIWGVVHNRIATGRTQQLRRISPALSVLALTPAIGAEAAASAIRRSHPAV